MIALFMDVQPVWKSTDMDQDTIEEGEMMYGEEAFPVSCHATQLYQGARSLPFFTAQYVL